MIQLATPETRRAVREIWKEVFQDDDAYLDILFSDKYKDENTLIATTEGKVVAALQMHPYEITCWHTRIPFYYLMGLSTLPAYRGKRYMGALIEASHSLMKQRNIPLSILVPAEQSLFGYYERFGYAQTFQQGEKELPSLKRIVEASTNRREAYAVFDEVFNRKDFCVQKSFDDFETIVKEAEIDNFPAKKNLGAASYLVDPLPLLDVYAQSNQTVKLRLSIASQPETIEVEMADGKARELKNVIDTGIAVDRRELVQLLFGFRPTKAPDELLPFFPEQKAVINYMLE